MVGNLTLVGSWGGAVSYERGTHVVAAALSGVKLFGPPFFGLLCVDESDSKVVGDLALCTGSW